jgi:putative transposase
VDTQVSASLAAPSASSSTPKACPSDTSTLEVLRRPVEFTQFTSIRYGERLAEIGAVPSIGTVGDSYDNALAETVNGYYKSELIYGPARTGPWKTVEDVELATLSWVHWHNTGRLHGYLSDIPPAEFEATFYATNRTDQTLVEIQ